MKAAVIIFLMLLQTAAFSEEKEKRKGRGAKEKKERFLSPESPLNHEFLDLKKPIFSGETSLNFNLRDPLNGISGGESCSVCSR